MTVINAVAAANRIISEQNRAIALAHAALTHAKNELGAMLMAGAPSSTRNAFDSVCTAIARIEGRQQMTDRDRRYQQAMNKVYAIMTGSAS
jgi:hypothetical protein